MPQSTQKTLAAIAFGAVLAGCSALGGSHPLPATQPNSRDAGTGGTRAALVFHIPRRHARAHYISAATQSASLTIAPGTGCTTCSPASTLAFNLTRSSPGCHMSSGETTCRVQLELKPGSYTGSLVTYDQKVGVKGNELSANQSFPMKVQPGIANAVGVTLYGVPSSILFSQPSGAIDLAGPNYDPNVDLLGAGSHGSFHATVVDAGNNAIVGPDAPTISAVSATGGFAATHSAGTISVSAPSTVTSTVSGLHITVSSPECSQPGGYCNPVYNLGFEPVLAVANGGTNTVLLEAADSASTSPHYAAVSTGIYHPADVKFDKTGNLFVANQSPTHGSVLEYASPYTAAAKTTITGSVDDPFALDLSPNNSLAVAQGSAVLVYASPYNGAPVTISVTPLAIAFDENNNLWVALAGSIKRYTAASNYATADVTITDHVNTPESIAIDNAGDLYSADTGNQHVYLYKSPYSSLTSTVLTYGASGGGYVAVIPGNGDVLICAAGNNEEIYTGLNSTADLNALMGKTPNDCRGAFDGNADLWVSDETDNGVFGGIARYGAAPGWIQTTFSSPGAIAAFPSAFIGT